MVKNGHIPDKNKDWLDKIRETGNEATHEIYLLEKDDADRIIKFTEMLLKLLYEFPEELK